ncbi:hypothetical protein C8J57DRAFT_1229517 [Mycena rebaudengoi]|nr:hypothetical protein C8J57DRAFT_1229517 [Mycena rebaudengoi]
MDTQRANIKTVPQSRWQGPSALLHRILSGTTSHTYAAAVLVQLAKWTTPESSERLWELDSLRRLLGNYGDPSFAIERVLGHLRPSSKSREGFGVELSATLQRHRGELGGGDLRQEELAEEAKRMSRE